MPSFETGMKHVAGRPLPAGSTAKEMEAAVRELRGNLP